MLAELFWRQFNNRREVGACVGLVPQPYDMARAGWTRGSARRATDECGRY